MKIIFCLKETHMGTSKTTLEQLVAVLLVQSKNVVYMINNCVMHFEKFVYRVVFVMLLICVVAT